MVYGEIAMGDWLSPKGGFVRPYKGQRSTTIRVEGETL